MMNEPKQLEGLWALYRAEFEEWASQVSRLDQIRHSVPERSVLADAQCRTTAAEASYREVRNRLAEEMGGSGGFPRHQGASTPPDSP